jgi:hypothetical protein
MSNDLILSIKNSLASLKGGVDDDTRAVAGGGGNGKRISIKGGVFRKFVGGKETAKIEDRSMNVIFVKMAHAPSRTFYSEGYKEGERVSPTCWSTDSKVPDSDVKSPQAQSCDACPNSIKGSGQGGTGSACRLQWRTAVVLPHDPSGDVMQLVLPSTSCFGKEEGGKWPFRPYIQMLAANNISAGRVVTRMGFDTNSPVPKLLFSPVAAVEEVDIETLTQQSASQAALNAVKLTVYQQEESATAPATPEFVGPPKPTAEQLAERDAEPVLREAKKAEATEADVPDIIKKWAKKK